MSSRIARKPNVCSGVTNQCVWQVRYVSRPQPPVFPPGKKLLMGKGDAHFLRAKKFSRTRRQSV